MNKRPLLKKKSTKRNTHLEAITNDLLKRIHDDKEEEEQKIEPEEPDPDQYKRNILEKAKTLV